MISYEIADIPLKHLRDVGAAPSDRPSSFILSNNIKNLIIDGELRSNLSFVSGGTIEFEIPKSYYVSSVYTELSLGSARVKEQCKNVNLLCDGGGQSAWILITAYYASFFMLNDISKASGQFSITLSKDELDDFKRNMLIPEHEISADNGSVVFGVLVSPSENDGAVKLKLRKNGVRPHVFAWSNFYSIISKINGKIARDSNKCVHFNLIKNISSLSNIDWKSPSTVRNEWNYQNSTLYGENGDNIAREFRRILSNYDTAIAWGGKIRLYPTSENTCASVAYVYHVIRCAYDFMLNRLSIG